MKRKLKQKSGFTLVEILAVITILGILATLAVTSAVGISNNLKGKMYCEKLEFILSAAKTYGADNYNQLVEDKNSAPSVKVGKLVEEGYLKQDQDKTDRDGKVINNYYMVNPLDNESMDDFLVKVYKKNKRAYACFVESSVTNSCEDIYSCTERP